MHMLPGTFLMRHPRATSNSCLVGSRIGGGAARAAERLAAMQLAACHLGAYIVKHTFEQGGSG